MLEKIGCVGLRIMDMPLPSKDLHLFVHLFDSPDQEPPSSDQHGPNDQEQHRPPPAGLREKTA
jgi:hypothetical protein